MLAGKLIAFVMHYLNTQFIYTILPESSMLQHLLMIINSRQHLYNYLHRLLQVPSCLYQIC
jgi:hypothetical protein